MQFETVKTPCIGVCSTGIGDDVCRGCKRYAHEIINWNAYLNEEKRIVESRLSTLLTQVISNKIIITDKEVLMRQIDIQPVDIPKHRNYLCQAYTLIKAGASQIKNPEAFGFKIQSEFIDCGLSQICDDIDSEFYTLSLAHYERCFLKMS